MLDPEAGHTWKNPAKTLVDSALNRLVDLFRNKFQGFIRCCWCFLFQEGVLCRLYVFLVTIQFVAF